MEGIGRIGPELRNHLLFTLKTVARGRTLEKERGGEHSGSLGGVELRARGEVSKGVPIHLMGDI